MSEDKTCPRCHIALPADYPLTQLYPVCRLCLAEMKRATRG